VFGEDPTVNRLQEKVAKLLGKEKALFVPSGTMANQTAINAHTQPGDEVICEYHSHIFNYEGGAPAMLSGVQLHPVLGKRGIITVEQIQEAVRPADHHYPVTRLIALENTHNRGGGSIFPLDEMKRIYAFAREHGYRVHLDGARLWNASIATGIPLEEYARYADSVAVCLSKGLGAPVGSLVAGDAEFIDKVHRYRKVYGGGMRQAGILAAAGIYAIDNHFERLAEDHRRAKAIAEGIAHLPGVELNPKEVETNIILFTVRSPHYTADAWVERMREKGILMLTMGPDRVRMVTHLHITDEDVDRVIDTFKREWK
jgi:threonine aldolase